MSYALNQKVKILKSATHQNCIGKIGVIEAIKSGGEFCVTVYHFDHHFSIISLQEEDFEPMRG